ncbi:cell envelope biogenesis protein OmpA [Hyunsoonleella ulvae]|uniref:cell envelope biogenesis protein OmpA n=1 Tax=Hyunsoonleella ulvae TaxID=2799948 RepID=UPI001939F389|nr:cell envelope biogenesis protein OmpA [Hyunsoonleella ulvae]
MNPKINVLKSISFLVLLFVGGFNGFSQVDTSKIKAQIAVGVSSPSSSGFVTTFKGKPINFPAVNLGMQYMFTSQLGAKLDYGFSRISNDNTSPEFKLNYSRINLQGVCDASGVLSFSQRMGVFLHAGPGVSMIKPLGDYANNNVSFINVVTGLELHYGVSDNLTLYMDTSYIFGFGKDFNPVSDGFGAFNGNLLTVTFGVSISLSGCYFCGN